MEATLSLKLTFGSDLRRFSVARNISFSELRAFVEKHLGLSHLIIKYVDDEEELVTIGSSIELEEAKRLQPEVLRLTVLESKDSKKIPLATSQDNVGGLNASLVRDVTIADGSQVTVNTPFKKIWRLKNNGDTDWPDHVRLALVGPENYQLGGAATGVSVRAVKVGQEVDVSIDLLAPKNEGRYVGYWRLHNGQEPFGPRIWVDVIIVASKADEEEAKRKEEEKKKAEEDAWKKAEEDAKKAAEEAAAAKKKAEEEEAAAAKKKAEEDARKKAEEEAAAKKKAEEEEAAKKRAEEEAAAAKKKAEQEAAAAKKKAEEDAKKKAEEDARKKAEEEAAAAKKKAEEDAKKKAEEEAKRRAEEEAARQRAEEEKKKAEEDARKKAEEEAKKFIFLEQLGQLVEMGFTDVPKNKELLLRHNGNIEQTLEALFLA